MHASPMPASAPVEFDESLWPLLLLRYPSVPLTVEQYVAMLAQRSRYLERNERHVILHDMTLSKVVSASEHRRLQVEWLKREDARLRQWVVGVAFVTESGSLRLLLSIIMHLRPLAMPHRVVSRMTDAIPWLEALLRQSGLAVPLLRERLGVNPGRRLG